MITRQTATGRSPVSFPERATFDLPLTTSVIPLAGFGSVTYTRATPATVLDHEGIVRYCLSGEARFQGARRVENMTAHSKTFTNPTWTKANLLTVTGNAIAGPAGLGMATSLIETATTTQHGLITSNSYANVAGNVYISSFYAKAGARSFVQLLTNGAISLEYANFDLVNGIFSQSSAGVGAMVSVGDGWYRCSIKYTSLSSTTAVVYCMIGVSLADVRYQSYVGDGVSNVYIDAYQHEDVTGQSIKTPSEYVSTNLLSSPFHGAMVDGVKYFDTDISGNPIPENTLKGFLCEGARTNICNYSNIAVAGWGLNLATRVDNAGIVPDGSNSMVKIIPNAGTQSSYAYNVNITTTASIYTVSCYVKADGLNFVQLRFGAGISSGLANFDLLNGVVGTRSIWTSSGIEPVAAFPGVYRIWAVTNTVLAATAAIAIQIVPAANSVTGAPVTGDGVSGVMAWGMQIELGPNVSSYIPTTTTTVTRNIDVLTYDVKNVIANQGALSAVCSMNDNEIFDRRALNLSSFTVNRLHVQARTGGVPTLGIAYGDGVTVRGVTGVAAGTNNIAVSWTNGVGLNLYMNNIKYIGAFVPSLAFSTIDVGGGSLGYPLFGCVKNVRIWKTVPTDTELLFLSNNP